jgi:hypothetical protein
LLNEFNKNWGGRKEWMAALAEFWRLSASPSDFQVDLPSRFPL